ncbi:MAG TPA: hypothetical protein VK929_02380 [Longimicrobiales bacterium]|nr:hypothetical protein [Longimicrobiales bacterium]
MYLHALLPVAALVTALELLPTYLQAPGWQAWHGCWEVAAADDAEHLLCIVPGETASEVRMLDVEEDGTVIGEARVRADGTAHPVSDGGCTGDSRARWSADGRRVFLRTELDCDGYRRVSSNVLAMVSELEWVDVQASTIFDQHLTQVVRYRAVPAGAEPAAIRSALDESRSLVRQTARLVAAAPLGLPEIIEAASLLPAPSLQALLVAREAWLPLNGGQLIQLADAGVPEDVIDVLVALAHPQRFAIRQSEVVDGAERTRYGRVEECYDPFMGRMMYGLDCDARYARPLRHGYGYGRDYRWGGPWGWTPGGTTVVIVEPRESPPIRSGELVRGAGYTRGGASETSPAQGTAQPRSTGGSGSTSAGTSSAGAAATGSTSGATSATSSNSGTSTTGRTARPRNGGGGQS